MRPAGARDFAGLELLATAVLVLDDDLVVRHANPAAESLLETGAPSLLGQPICALFAESAELAHQLAAAKREYRTWQAQDVRYLRPGREALELSFLSVRTDLPARPLLVELRLPGGEARFAREERLLGERQAYRELLRNLAHEIRNPLGGLRGSAQLLDRALERRELREYTQVIIKEADRLQALLDRLLAPERRTRLAPVNLHEVLERVHRLVLAEFSAGIAVRRDYDPSLPEVPADKEQLIQAVLNIARNAAQALASPEHGGRGGTIVLRTRAARQVTLYRQRHRLALELQVIDDGPGIAGSLRERIFNPLVSGREGGSGLGLSLAQAFVQHHHGVIECDSRPGRTVFTILLPVP